MSKATKQSVFILIFLLLCLLGFSGYVVFEKEKLKQAKQSLEMELQETRERVKQYAQETKSLKIQIKDLDDERLRLAGDKTKLTNEVAQLQGDFRQAEQKAESFSNKIGRIERERDKWKRRMEGASQERDRLAERLEDLKLEKTRFEEKLAVAERKAEEAIKKSLITAQTSPVVSVKPKPRLIEIPSYSSEELKPAGDEEYWAAVLKEKASLEVEIEQMEEALSSKTMELVELKRTNKNLKIDYDDLKYQKEQNERNVAREIEYKNNMVNNLSLELARTKNDKKFIADRVVQLNTENADLRKEVKTLVSSKGALEKSIVQLSQDKGKIEKELGNTETLIQSKIDEIWDIKESLDETIRASGQSMPDQSAVELTPIVISSTREGNAQSFIQKSSNYNGRVVSLNEQNNFAIVDIGQESGVRLGDTLSVYRDSQYIARLEVIQVRKDIAAADLKDQWAKIRVGDIVK